VSKLPLVYLDHLGIVHATRGLGEDWVDWVYLCCSSIVAVHRDRCIVGRPVTCLTCLASS
jgi:hypothetical protein